MNPVQQAIFNALEWFLLTLFSVPAALVLAAVLLYFVIRWGRSKT